MFEHLLKGHHVKSVETNSEELTSPGFQAHPQKVRLTPGFGRKVCLYRYGSWSMLERVENNQRWVVGGAGHGAGYTIGSGEVKRLTSPVVRRKSIKLSRTFHLLSGVPPTPEGFITFPG